MDPQAVFFFIKFDTCCMKNMLFMIMHNIKDISF